MADIAPAAVWKQVVAAGLDFIMIFLAGGYLIAAVTGDLRPQGGFSLTGWPALALFMAIAAYFYVGRRIAGGTLWDRLLGIGRPQPLPEGARRSSGETGAGGLMADIAPVALWKRVVATILDGFTAFLSLGYVIGALTGGLRPGGVDLDEWPTLALFVAIAAYFYIGRRVAGGTPWDRFFGISRPQP